MKVYGFKEKMYGVMEIGDDLEVYREFVGGRLEVYCIGNGLDVVLNGEGRLEGLEPRAVHVEGKLIMQVIVGDCFVCRHDRHGNFVSIREEDTAYIEKKLNPITMYME